jgi:hypothetical protein
MHVVKIIIKKIITFFLFFFISPSFYIKAGNKLEVKNLFEELKTTNLLIDFAEALVRK